MTADLERHARFQVVVDDGETTVFQHEGETLESTLARGEADIDIISGDDIDWGTQDDDTDKVSEPDCDSGLVVPVGNANPSSTGDALTRFGTNGPTQPKRFIAAIIIAALAIALLIATGVFQDFGNHFPPASSSSAQTEAFSNGVETGPGGLAIKASLSDYSWDELSRISQQISVANSERETIEIAKTFNLTDPNGELDGSQVKEVRLTNGMSTNVQIIGFAHDNLSDGAGKAGITFLFNNAIAEHAMNEKDTNKGGWEKSDMRAWMGEKAFELLPSDLRKCIVAVDKPTNNTGETHDASSVTVTSDKLWLLSFCELNGRDDWLSDASYSGYVDVLNAEGLPYKLFRDQAADDEAAPVLVEVYVEDLPNFEESSSEDSSSEDNSILEKAYDGEPSWWWGRSPRPAYPNLFVGVNSHGNPSYADHANIAYAVVPGFCI